MGLRKEEITSYYYKVYGLIVESQVVLPELIVADYRETENIDVKVTYGTMPEAIRQYIDEGQTYGFEKADMWFSVGKVAHYHITKGDSIVVEPCENADKGQVKAFLLGTAFGLLLIQRDNLAIHGGTILINDKAVVFTGDTGAGKSTMTAAFREKGYGFLADDVSVVGQADGGINIIYPGYPQQKLCRDAVENMGLSPKDYVMIDDDRDKYIIPARDSFIHMPIPIGAIVELSIGEGERLEISEVLGSEKIIILMKNIYRIEATRFAGLSKEYFSKCLGVVKNVPIYRIKRPKGRNTIQEQIMLVLSTLDNKGSRAV